MAVYNADKRFLLCQLDSILAQTKAPDEVIISDDNSSDDTFIFISDYIKKHSLNWQIFGQKKNLGYIDNFAFLLGKAAGDYIALADQDDVWHSDKLAVMCAALDKAPPAMGVACAYGLIDGNGQRIMHTGKKKSSNHGIYPRAVPLGESEIVNSFSTRDMPECLCNRFIGCSVMLRRSVAEEYLAYKLHNIPHDWELCLIAEASGGMFFLNRELMDYRLHGGNTIGLRFSGSESNTPDEDSRKRLALEFYNAAIRMKEICARHSIEAPKNIERYAEKRIKVTSDYSAAAWISLLPDIKLYRRQCSLRQRLGDLYVILRHKLRK